MSRYGWRDCPDAVREQVVGLRQGLIETLSDDLVGLYLHGSLAMRCFNPERSDLDLLAVARQRMPVEIKRQVAELLLQVSRLPAPIEISVLDLAELHPWKHPASYDFHFSENWRARFEQELASGEWRNWNAQYITDADLAAHVTVTLKRGICVWGRPILDVFPPVPAEHYADSIIGDLHWSQERISELPVYFILNACRICAYLLGAKVCSKDEGGEWALQTLPDSMHPLVRQALTAYRGSSLDGQFEQTALNELATYVERIIEQNSANPSD